MFGMKSKRKKDDDWYKDVHRYGLIRNIRYIYKLMFKHFPVARLIIVVHIIMMVVVPVITTIMPSVAVNAIEKNVGFKTFSIQMLGIVALFMLGYGIQTIASRYYTAIAMRTRAYKVIRLSLIKALKSDYDIRESNKNEELFVKAAHATDSNWVGVEGVYLNLPMAIYNAFGLALYGGAILMVDFRILIILLVMAIFNILLNNYARRYTNKIYEENRKLDQKNMYLQERMKSIYIGKDARVYRMHRWFEKITKDNLEKGIRWQKRIEKRWLVPVTSDTIWGAIRDFGAYYILIIQLLDNKISIATFTLYLGVIATFSSWFFGFIESVNSIRNENQKIDALRTELDFPDVFKHGCGKKAEWTMDSSPYTIEFRDVCYSYGEEPVLSHFNLKIGAGEKIALVGSNGAGKTTIVKLLCGFYHPTSGKILVNGIDIEEYDIEEYYKLINAVFQDISPLSFTIANNVSGCADEETNMDRLWDALKRADLYDKVQELKNKEKTYITQIFSNGGINLSGGETQKLMLARAIYKEAPILILDEPTSALDPIAESRLYDSYNEISKNRTSIFISHRLASTRFCDRIIYLEAGKVKEEGTHDELIKLAGSYARVYQIQSHYYKEDESTDKMDAAYTYAASQEAVYE